MKTTWPIGKEQPFGIQSDYSWMEMGALLQLIGDYSVTLFIETGVGRGDLAAMMLARCMYDPAFSYISVTANPDLVDPTVISQVEQQKLDAFIVVGVPCSTPVLDKLARRIKNSHKTLVFCNGVDAEKEFDRYSKILRPGDLLAAFDFPVKFRLAAFSRLERSDRIVRITGNFMGYTRIIAGEII